VGKSVQPRKVREAAKKEAARCPVSFERPVAHLLLRSLTTVEPASRTA